MRTTSLRITDRIRSLVRAEYDEIDTPYPPEGQLPVQMRFFSLIELARFWDDSQSAEGTLCERQQRLISGLHGIRKPWAYVILGDHGSASILLGFPIQGGDEDAWGRQLASQLPGSTWRPGQSAGQVVSTLASFPIVANISGNPSIPPMGEDRRGQEQTAPSVEPLIETMAGFRWAYLVLARPLGDAELTEDVHRIEAELQEINGAYLRRSSAEENNNPTVERYASLLEATHQRLLQGQRQGMWDVQSYLLADNATSCERGAQAIHAAFSGPDSAPQPIRIKIGDRAISMDQQNPLSTRLNSSEVAVLASLPRREVAGLQVAEYVPFGMTATSCGAAGLALGKLMWGGMSTQRWYGIERDMLRKHLFVPGVPGSGKTRTMFYLLYQLWRDQSIPWLVLEPSMKSEYRALLQSGIGSDLRVFTAGDEGTAPLRVNPLEVLPGIHVQTHIASLGKLFRASFAMEAPMPYVLDEALHRVYEERGWDMVTGKSSLGDPDCQPTLDDLLAACRRSVEDLGHEQRVKDNIWGAIKTRLSSLMRGAKGRMLNVRQSFGIADLLSAPTVIELAAIGDDEEKAFLLGCILLKLEQHRQAEGPSRAGLKHVTVIEEAHRLLRNVAETPGTSVANPRHQAVEQFSAMLAELREYGEGLVVVDQMPSKLIPDVIRNTCIKIVHRLTAEEERRLIAGAMCLNDAQTRFLSSLPTGQAIVYADGSLNACRVNVPDHAGLQGYVNHYPSNKEVGAHMRALVPAAFETTGGLDTHAEAIRPASPAGASGNASASLASKVRHAIDAYVSHISGLLEDRFKRATTDGFDELWKLGEQVASEACPSDPRSPSVAFYAIIAVARKTGLADKDMHVLRGNMNRILQQAARGEPQ